MSAKADVRVTHVEVSDPDDIQPGDFVTFKLAHSGEVITGIAEAIGEDASPETQLKYDFIINNEYYFPYEYCEILAASRPEIKVMPPEMVGLYKGTRKNGTTEYLFGSRRSGFHLLSKGGHVSPGTVGTVLLDEFVEFSKQWQFMPN